MPDKTGASEHLCGSFDNDKFGFACCGSADERTVTCKKCRKILRHKRVTPERGLEITQGERKYAASVKTGYEFQYKKSIKQR